MNSADVAIRSTDFAPTLFYADLPSRWGVTVEPRPDGVRLVVPPVPSWRQLGREYYAAVALLGCLVAAFVVVLVSQGLKRGAELTPFVINVVFCGIGLLAVLLAARYRLRRRIAFEVTARTVSATYLYGGRGSRGVGRRMEWPREKVADIRLNASNQKLFFRVAGVSFVELYLGPNQELNAYVADTLAAALRTPVPTQPAGEPLSAGRDAEFDPATNANRAAAARSRAMRRWLMALSFVMATAGVIMLFMPLPFGPIGIYTLIFSVAPAGIALGTQNKEYYA